MEFLEYLGYAELASKGVISDWILAGAGMHEREMQSFGGVEGLGGGRSMGRLHWKTPGSITPYFFIT